jgi:hypothetical protein
MNIDYSKYQAEAAKSNRALCRETSCKVNIGLGDLRIGRMGSDYYSWYHAPCCWKTFDNWRIRNSRIQSTADIENFEALSDAHKDIIIQLIEGTYIEPPAMTYNPRPKRQCAAKGAAAAPEAEQPDTNVATEAEGSNSVAPTRKRKSSSKQA